MTFGETLIILLETVLDIDGSGICLDEGYHIAEEAEQLGREDAARRHRLKAMERGEGMA